MSEQLEAIKALSDYILNEDWDKVGDYLTDDILYRVGSGEPQYGKQAVIGFLSNVFKTTAKLTGHDVRKLWEEPGIITIEMEAKYHRHRDNADVGVACCDVYRMQGNKVAEWRVYADGTPLFQ